MDGRRSPTKVGCLFGVAQIFNLPYRRIVFGKARDRFDASAFPKGWQSATLRYSRLQVCATSLAFAPNRYKVGVVAAKVAMAGPANTRSKSVSRPGATVRVMETVMASS